MPETRAPETRSHKAHAIWAFLDENPTASITQIKGACGIDSKTTVVEQRKAWRAAREAEAKA